MKKNKLQNIFLIILNIIMLALNFFVGPSIKEPVTILFLVITFFTFIYLIFNFKKNKFICNKIDIFFILFMLSSMIPLIFNTYVSLSEEYNSIQECISILSVYFLIKNLSTNKKNKDIIINTLIFSTIPIIIIAFDRLYTNYIWEHLNDFDIFKIDYKDDGLLANFNYPNSLAIYLSSIFFLILGQILKNKNKIKLTIYKGYSFILLLLIILTESRASILMLGMFLLIYLFLIKDKNKVLQIIQNLFISFIGIILYFLIFNIFTLTSTLKIVILILIISLVLIINYLSDKISLNIRNINFKKFLIIISIILICGIIYVLITINYSKPTIVESQANIKLKNIESKNEYNIKLDINTEIKARLNENFRLEIYTFDNYDHRETIVEEAINDYSGIKEYKLENLENVAFLSIRIFSYNKDNKLMLNKIYIDDEEYITNYKYLPNKIGNMLKSLKINDLNLIHRIDYYKDSLKILENNWLFGTGNGSWKYLYTFVQSYSYATKEVHSFLLDIFICFGIFGIITLLLIIACLIYYSIKIIKNKNDDEYFTNITLIIAIFLLFIHSLIDFDMSFSVIKFYFYSLIALFSLNYKKTYKINKLTNIIILIIIFVSSLFNMSNFIGETWYKNYTGKDINKFDKFSALYPTNYKIKLDSINKTKMILLRTNENTTEYNNLQKKYIDNIIKLIETEPYLTQNTLFRNLSEQIIIDINNKNINEYYINTMYNLLSKYKYNNKYNLIGITERARIMSDIYKNYKNYAKKYNSEYLIKEANKIKELLLSEYNKNITNLDNYKKTDYSKNIFKKYIQTYEQIINEIENSS